MQPLHLKLGENSSKIPSFAAWIHVYEHVSGLNRLEINFTSAAPVMGGWSFPIVNNTSWDRL